jgi:hypothetical protein
MLLPLRVSDSARGNLVRPAPRYVILKTNAPFRWPDTHAMFRAPIPGK